MRSRAPLPDPAKHRRARGAMHVHAAAIIERERGHARRDEDRLERLSNSRSSNEAMRFVTELRCEKLRPQLFRLTERLDYPDPMSAAVATQDPSSAVATQNPSSRVVQVKVTSGIALARVARWGASEPQNRARWSIASRSPQQRRRANGWTGSSLPPIFLALFGEQPRNSTTFRRTRAWGRCTP